MALTDSLRILITANGAQAEREFSKVGAAARTNLGHAETSAQRFGRSLTSAGVAMAAFGGVALVGLYKAAQAAQEEDLAIAKLNNSIANSPELANASSEAFLDQAAALQDVTTFTDDATISAQAMLGTFHLTQREIMGLTPLVQDLAAKFDLDLNRASMLVGKAMDGNIGALQRMGVRIDETAFATDRFGAVMTALRENAGGFARKEGRTFNGQMEIMKNNLGDIAEGIGRGAVEAFNSMLGPVKSLSGAFEDLNPETQSAIGKFATFGAAGLTAAGGISFLAGQVITAAQRFQTLRTAMAGANTSAIAAYGPWGALAALFGLIATGVIDLSSAMTEQELDTQNIDEMTAAMTEAGSAVEGLAAHFRESADPSFFDAMGVNADQFAEALLSTESQWDSFVERVIGNLPEGADIGQWTEALELHRDRAQASAGALDLQATSARQAGLELQANATSADEAASAIDNLSTRISNYIERVYAVGDASDATELAFHDLYEELIDGNRAFDGNTRGAIENRAALDSVVTAVATQIDTMQRQGRTEEQLQRTKQESIRRIQAAADAHLIERDAANEAIRAIRGIPERRNFTMGVNADIGPALTGLDRLSGRIRDVAQAYASADFNRGLAATGGGGGGGGGGGYNGPPPGGVNGNESVGRAIARELQKGAIPVVVVG